MSEPRTAPHRRAAAPPQVQLRWLLSALGLLGLAACCCGYLALGLLFLQGQWQLLYHPATVIAGDPSALGLTFQLVRFDADEAGVTQLTGWWVPPPQQGALAATVLYLHDGTGSLFDTLPAIAHLHALGATVLAIDYRGYGASRAEHPSEAHMIEDAQAALVYLEQTRHIPSQSIVLWGRGIGATIAAEAAAKVALNESQVKRLVLDQPNAPALELLGKDPRTRLLPVRLLLRDPLDASSLVATSHATKLFLTPGQASSSSPALHLYDSAAEPKSLAVSGDEEAVRRFLVSH